nr:MAG TPA: hypothetical protein [Caudoviricetes sp.]
MDLISSITAIRYHSLLGKRGFGKVKGYNRLTINDDLKGVGFSNSKDVHSFPCDVFFRFLTIFLKGHFSTGLREFEWEEIAFLFGRYGLIKLCVASHMLESTQHCTILKHLDILTD